jgi:hypothetical protein
VIAVDPAAGRIVRGYADIPEEAAALVGRTGEFSTDMKDGPILAALLHKSKAQRDGPNPRRSYAMAAKGTVVGRPSCVKRLSRATRTGNSTT